MGSSLENYNFVNSIACGKNHCLLLTTSGFCYAFGDNQNGRLGLGDTDYREEPSMLYNLLDFSVESVHCTDSCSFACCKIRNDIPVPITHKLASGESVTTVVDSDKKIIFNWGDASSGCLLGSPKDDLCSPEVVGLSVEEPLTQLVTGKRHVFAVNSEKNCIYAWGNYYEELVSFVKAAKSLKGKPKIFGVNGVSTTTLT
jgi:alpha-tubulin suppressor-like RCC1 family protein